MDNASDFGSEDWGFESSRLRHFTSVDSRICIGARKFLSLDHKYTLGPFLGEEVYFRADLFHIERRPNDTEFDELNSHILLA